MLIESVIKNEKELVKNYQDFKCSESFGALYEIYYKQVFEYIYGLTHDYNLAFDLTQETFIKVAKKIDLLREADLFKFWLFRIARNTTYKYFRNLRFTLPIDAKKEIPFIESDMETILQNEKEFSDLEKLLAKLNKEDRYLIQSRYFDEKSISDLTVELGLGASAVKMKIHRIRLRLKKELMN